MVLDLMTENMWGLYLCLFLAPFVQEDAAVITAASVSASGMGSPPLIFLIALMGLSASDLWKYWLGRAAHSQGWAHRYGEGIKVRKAKAVVKNRLGQAILAARFIPGTRIVLYIAAGYFRIDFLRFALWIVISATLLLVGLFILFHTVGGLIGDRAILGVSITMLTVLTIGLMGKALLNRRQDAAP